MIILIFGLYCLIFAAAFRPDSSSAVHTSIKIKSTLPRRQAISALAAFSMEAYRTYLSDLAIWLSMASRVILESSTTKTCIISVLLSGLRQNQREYPQAGKHYCRRVPSG